MLGPNSLQAPRYQLKKRRAPQPPKTAGSALPPPPVRALRPAATMPGPKPSSICCR